MDIAKRVEALLPVRKGHFRLESGHHGELWLDLEKLCCHVAPVRALTVELAKRLASHEVDAVCGPLVEGAFVGLFAAEALDVPFMYTEREEGRTENGLYSFRYRIPRALRDTFKGKNIAIVNDVVNAGSAVFGTVDDVESIGARVSVVGTLALLGEHAGAFCRDRGIALETLATIPNTIYTPLDCPLCAKGIPITND